MGKPGSTGSHKVKLNYYFFMKAAACAAFLISWIRMTGLLQKPRMIVHCLLLISAKYYIL
jgi:hypothetical protein